VLVTKYAHYEYDLPCCSLFERILNSKGSLLLYLNSTFLTFLYALFMDHLCRLSVCYVSIVVDIIS